MSSDATAHSRSPITAEKFRSPAGTGLAPADPQCDITKTLKKSYRHCKHKQHCQAHSMPAADRAPDLCPPQCARA
ncbi:hypothetical protein COCON_G00216550 [Conger conger]|uniref:Uncharacterized protein n=1 Tax=Conger conger TaxID=82655 RepID=A0A9Q1CY48_CONCO|nr:hypothetical protein COCON_G00216550 [Conger conger]